MKDRILRAAAKEIGERGAKFTLESLAENLGISKKTVYQYYSSKAELISNVVDTAIADIEQQKAEIMTGNSGYSEKLAAFLTLEPRSFEKAKSWFLDDLKKYYPDEWEKINKHRRDCLSQLEQILIEGINGGYLRPFNATVAAYMIDGAFAQLLDSSLLKECNQTVSDVLKEMSDIVLNGLSNRPIDAKGEEPKC